MPAASSTAPRTRRSCWCSSASLPFWIVLAKLHGLYEGDEERADHSTIDEVVGVLHLVATGIWLIALPLWALGLADPKLRELALFGVSAFVLVTIGRSAARAVCRRSVLYLQNTVIIGAGDVGQLVARKLLQHPEYGLNLVGFVDPEPREPRIDLEHLTLLGTPAQLPRSSASSTSSASSSPSRTSPRKTSWPWCGRAASSTCRSTSCRASSTSSGRAWRCTPSRACR